MSTDIAQIRRDYSLQSLDIQDVDKNPLHQFDKWLQEAIKSELPEPTAMHLATVSAEGKPSGRIVLLKGADNQGLVFFTNYTSAKGNDMQSNANVALTFFWAELERQVRIEGVIEKVPENESLTYFQSRPRASQIGALASPQSKKIEDRAWLEQKFATLEKELADKAIPKPEHWGGYRVIPQYFEFWQGRRSRLHDRIVYEKQADDWEIYRIAP
jgi:pyridoxamine 5'-phosphate oxidase